MKMKINQNKLPIKYLLNVYKEMESFPSHTDLTYMLLSNLSDKEELNSPFTPSQVWPYMKDGVGTISELSGFLDYAADPEDCPGAFLQRIGLTSGKKPEMQYQVINNPWS
ncbi:MAG: hypothetical protein RLZZ479_395 [Bacteroidota bacterium]|jgi:hypothetical protein